MKTPTQYGPYLLLERISVGGMAEVYKAKEYGVEGFERTVAVKRILPHVAEDDEFIAMFKDEAKIAVQLNHGNIAQIYNLGNEHDSFYIALEYVAGRDLRTIFQRSQQQGQPMPVAQACYIIMKICEGLDYAHNKKDKYNRPLSIVHRDVSPPNILVSYEGEVKLIDFGVAKAAGRASRTQAGILKGKFGYMSPEQVRGMPLDRRSDVFSVGVVLFEILCGQRLFQAETDFATLEKVRAVDVPRPASINPNIPKALENIMFKALTREPEQRYQSAIELHDELQAFMFAQGLFYSRKDLAAWMRENYAREIDSEKEKAAAQADLRPEQFGPSGRGAPVRPPPPPSAGRPPPPPPRGRPAKSPPKPAGAEARGKKAPKRKTMVMTTSRNLPPPPGKRSRPGGASPAGKPAPDPPTVPLASFKPGGAPPKPKAKPVPKPTGRPAPKPTASYAASAPPSDFDWDDDELETRLFEDDDDPGPSKGGGARTSSPGEPARNGLSSVPTKVDVVGAKAPVPSVIPAPGVVASTDPGPDKGMTMVPGQVMASPHMQMPASSAPAQVGQGAPLASGFGGSAPTPMPPQPGMSQPPSGMPPQPGMPQQGGYPGAPAMAMGGGAPGMVPSGSTMAMPPGVGGYEYDDRPRKSNAGPIIVIVIALLVLFTAALVGVYVLLKDKDKESSSKSGSPAATESPEAGGTKEASSAGEAQAALTVLVTPPDARVSVDGKEHSASSTVVVSVTPGKHAVKVTHDAHFDFETEVEVTAAGLRLPVTLQPKAVKLSFELVPAEAKASLLSGGQVVGTGSNGSQLPVVRKPSVDYEVEVSAPGYTSKREPLVFSGAASQTVVVTLAKAAGSTPSTTPTPPSTKSKPKPKPKPKPVAKTSTLRIGTKGGVLAAKAYVDGKYVGTTPVLNVRVTPGKHAVKFTWTDGRAPQTLNVNVADGATEVVKGG